jgi:Cof subfamily protein (haloacid dehalogenase superfamily)
MAAQKFILCIDLDGTLIDAQEKVHPKDIWMLKNLPEVVQPVLTTGRILHSAKGVLQENGLFPQTVFPLAGVFMNGGVAFKPDEILTIHHTFLPHVRTELVDLAHTFHESAFVFFSLTQVYMLNPTPFSLRVSTSHYLDAQMITGQNLPQEIVKLMILEDQPEKLSAIQKAAASIDGEKAYTLPTAYEINPPGINKANTLKDLLKQLDWETYPVVTVGDAENDLALFELADVSFAPSSAHPKLLTKADHVINRNKSGLLLPILEQIEITL